MLEEEIGPSVSSQSFIPRFDDFVPLSVVMVHCALRPSSIGIGGTRVMFRASFGSIYAPPSREIEGSNLNSLSTYKALILIVIAPVLFT